MGADGNRSDQGVGDGGKSRDDYRRRDAPEGRRFDHGSVARDLHRAARRRLVAIHYRRRNHPALSRTGRDAALNAVPTSQEIVRELETFYRHYIDVFNREDERYFDCLAPSYGMVSGERGLSATANDEKHRAGFRRMMTALKERGWVRSGIDRIMAWAFGDNLGMIISDVTRYKTDQSVLEKLRACYMVRRDDDSWKIVTIGEIKPPFLGPGDVPR